MTETTLRVCTFKGLQNLPLYVAIQQGFFAMRGLRVEMSYTAGSAPQIAGLARGDYDLIQTAPDNVINANNNPAAFGLEDVLPRPSKGVQPTVGVQPYAPTAAGIVMVFGGSVGPLSLYARSGVATCDGLRGAVLGVDNPTSGFALVLRDVLARHGLALDDDYTVAVAGGTSSRLDALRAGTVTATVLYAPFDALAEEEGFRRLATSTALYAAYASLAIAGIFTWVEAHSDEVVRYIVAVRQALRWIYDPAHRDAAQSIVRAEPSLGLDASVAARAYDAFVDPVTGFGVDGALSEAGLQQVIDLRATYGDPPRPLGLPADYLDPRLYRYACANE